MSVVLPARPVIPIALPFVGAEEEAAVTLVLRSGWLSQGPQVAEFERRFAQFVGARHAIAVSSCTTGLHLALIAAGIGSGDDVLCPSLSFIATANAIRYTGARPVFVDVDRQTYNIDPLRIASAVTKRTRAILVVHQIGLAAALDHIVALAERHGLTVIEDAACAIGSAYEGRRIGAPHSRMAVFSFHPRKIMTTGEGGMITTNDEQLADVLRRTRQHGMTVSDVARHSAKNIVFERYDDVGYNYRMTDVQAAIGLVQLNRVDSFIERRRMLAARYTAALDKIGWLQAPLEPPGRYHNYQSYMARLAPDAPVSRDALMRALLDRGISTRRGIMAAHLEAPYRSPRWERELTETTAATKECIILPLFHELTSDEQGYIIESIRQIERLSAH